MQRGLELRAMPPDSSKKLAAELTIFGKDRKGIVSAITGYLFSNNGNIEAINQNVANGLFMMHLEVAFPLKQFSQHHFEKGLHETGKALGMEIKAHYQSTRRKRMALFVTRNSHCPLALLQAHKRGKLQVDIPLVIGNHLTLKSVIEKYNIPFYYVQTQDQAQGEARMLKLLEKDEVDFIVLARYMKILSPRFIWRYPNRIINIHPSILPAFPGAHAYLQAFNRGVKVMGCSAHFVTMDLDQGPIICQEVFHVTMQDTLDTIREKGERLEAKVLLQAVKLYLTKRLEVYWGRVAIKA